METESSAQGQNRWRRAPTARITRRATFAAAHVLRRSDWDEDRNREIFGACVGEHGHNYVLEVTVTGRLDPDTGMIINLKRLDAVIREQFIDCVDHKHLNRDVPFLHEVIPTAENVALAAWQVLQPALAPIELVRIRVAESENNSAEVVGA
jgi:6-pyruvoyltetrahydropterin/6-carboxytetrahydropterin synthase